MKQILSIYLDLTYNFLTWDLISLKLTCREKINKYIHIKYTHMYTCIHICLRINIYIFKTCLDT